MSDTSPQHSRQFQMAVEIEGTASLPDPNTRISEDAKEEFVTVPLYMVNDDIRVEIGTAEINTKTLVTKGKVTVSEGMKLFEVTATKFSFGRSEENN